MNTTETIENPKATQSTGPSLVGWLALLILVAYPLSTGPVAKLIELKYLPEDPFVAFYSPLMVLVEHFEPAADFLNGYLVQVWRCHF